MPTRLPVLLQRRKSALAGAADDSTTNAQTSGSIQCRGRKAPLLTKLAPIRAIRIMPLRISRWFHAAVNEDGAEVIDVREGGTRAQETAHTFEEAGGIVVGKKRGRIEAKFLRARKRPSVDIGAGGVGGRAGAAIGPIGVGGERRDAAGAGEFDRKREGVLLVRPAAALAPHRDGELAAGEEEGGGRAADFARFRGMRARDLARFAFDIGAEEHAVVAGRAHSRL